MGGTVLAFREVEREGYGRRRTRDSSGEAAPGPRGVPEIGGQSFEPGADPAADPGFLEALGDEIVTLAAHIHAATCRFLRLIARFDRLGGWVALGHASCAHWLHFRTGLSLGTAREHVRVARAMEALPETTASMARGRLSFSKVRALTRAATPENETDLLELAEGSTTAQLERMVRGWKKASRRDEASAERARHRARTLSVFPDDDGMYVVRGLLEPEVGALLDAGGRGGERRALPGGAGWGGAREAERAGGGPRRSGHGRAPFPAVPAVPTLHALHAH